MPKVKKAAKKASVRNLKPRQKKRSAGTTRKSAGRKTPIKPARAVAGPRYDIKPLDPVRSCGPGTSVEQLFKVVETMDGRSINHLVFLDRHGWYCEHGRVCPAVAQAKKY